MKTKTCICGYEADIEKWTTLRIASSTGLTYLTCYSFDNEQNKYHHYGSIEIYSCPKCGLVYNFTNISND